MHYTIHAIEVMREREILKEWVEEVLKTPSVIYHKSDVEVHYFKPIAENGMRCLKVVVNPLMNTVVTTYFDRQMRKRGCR